MAEARLGVVPAQPRAQPEGQLTAFGLYAIGKSAIFPHFPALQARDVLVASYLVTYDFKSGASNQWAEFVKCAEPEGLIYVYDVGDELARLTNTTLWGLFENKQAVKAAFGRAQAAAEKKLGRAITLEKRVITKMIDVFVRSDVKKKADQRWTKSTKFETCRTHQKNDPFFAY